MKTLEGRCERCGRPLVFPAEAVGNTARCRFCGAETELLPNLPRVESGVPRRAVVWAVVGLLVGLAGLGAAWLLLQRARGLKGRSQPAAPAAGPANRTPP